MNLPNDIQVIYFKSYISDLIQISQMVGGIARKQMVWNLIRFQRLLGGTRSRSRQVHLSKVVWTIPSKTKHLAPSFFEKVQIGRSGGPGFWVIWKVRDPQDLIFKTQDLWFQPLIEVLSLHCPPILNFPCAGIPESPKMYQPRQNHHIPQMNKNSSYVKKI